MILPDIVVQWEYKSVDRLFLLPEEELNEYGLDGWDLITIVLPNNTHFGYTYVFKRVLNDYS